jgi:hypothetical protein
VRRPAAKCRFSTEQSSITPPPAMSSKKPEPPRTNVMDYPAEPPTIEVTPEIKMKNAAVAAFLICAVTSIWYYSMSAVGSQGSDSDDPLAQLKMEAQEAMDRQEKENNQPRAKQLLQEFNRGEHDPDKAEVDALEELEQEEQDANKKKKKSWWKLW